MREVSTQSFHTAQVHQPARLSSVETGRVDRLGRPERVMCTTCHSMLEPRLPESHVKLERFHVGLVHRHGELACGACHSESSAAHLHLATGEKIPTVQVMDLCGQCHGPQMRDYKHGAHGGMNGYWDLRLGPRSRNNCVDCHDPHTPQIPHVVPVFALRDRSTLLTRKGAH